MAIRPNDDERFGADRERQREVADESGRFSRPSSGDGLAAQSRAASA